MTDPPKRATPPAARDDATPSGSVVSWTRSIRTRAVVLLALVAGVPAWLVQQRLGAANRAAVEASEQSLQAAVLAEVAAMVRARVERTQAEANAVAQTLSWASQRAEGDGTLASVASMLATLTHVESCRFEVPSANVDTVLRRGPQGTTPKSTPELRALADAHGVARALRPEGVTLVVPTRGADAAARGYVTVQVNLGELRDGIQRSVLNRFEGDDACVAVADDGQHIVTSICNRPIAYGSASSALPIYGAFEHGVAPDLRLAVVAEFKERGEEFVGGVESIDPLGWTVAIWRPKARAYAALAALDREVTLVRSVTLVLSMAIALLAAAAITRPILRLAGEARKIARRQWTQVHIESPRRDEVGDLARAMETMARSLEVSEHQIAAEATLRNDLGRFLGRELVEAIVRGEHALALGGKRAEVSVMFADVVGFTPLAESRPAEQVVALLNELFSVLSEVIFRHGGTVDKFVGDCIMAVWGAPLAEQNHAQRALDAAEDVLRFLETANLDWRNRFDLEVQLAIGINSGEVLVGNIGSSKRMDYTVIGDAVNVAARLEMLAQPNQVLVGERTAELALDGASLRPLGEHRLIGRGLPIHVYSLEVDA